MREQQYEIAYTKLREKLITHTIKPGERLIEQQLAHTIGVNRGDIRQAFTRLLAEGLITRGEKGGMFAQEYSSDYIQEVLETRLVIEKAAASLAVKRANEADIQALESGIDHMKFMAENGYEYGFAEADMRFHETLVQAAHNGKLFQIYKLANLPLTFSFQKRESFHDRKTSMLQDARSHEQMVQALKGRRGEDLIALLTAGMEKGA